MSGIGGPQEAAVLAPYLPRIAIEWAGKSDERWLTVDASLAFVDVTGFTALSERLAAQGRAGAEEVTELLGECFTELLADAYVQGGSLLKFGGDALLLFFDGEAHPARAALAAAAMRRTIRRVGNLKTSVGNVRLRTSAGVHSGEVHLFRVGKSHRELIVTGPTPSQVLEMEAAAQAGQVVVSSATAAALEPELVGASYPPGFVLRDRAVRPTAAPFPETPAPTADLAEAVPVALRPHLLSGTVEPEHRHVAVAFVGYRLDHELLEGGAARAADALEELVTSIQDAADHYGVTFLGSDIDRDGGKILLVAGAPEARDDDSGRMLGALRRIADTPRSLPVRIGVNRGCVFVGDIGPQYRRTYTVMGDAVNLAARLMAAAAEGEILATEELMTTSRSAYDTTPRPPFAVKGKAKAVRAYSLGGVSRRGPRSQGAGAPLAPLVGRANELDQLLWMSAAANTGRGATVVITGPAGIGKSRLVAEFARLSPEAETMNVAAEPYEQTTPWALFGRFLRAALDLASQNPAETAGSLQRLAAATPEVLPWLPLVASVLGTSLPSTPEIEDLDPRFAADRRTDALAILLGARFPGPALLVFEDIQWADEASLAALQELSRAVHDQRPWLLVLTRRDGGSVSNLPSEHTELNLEPLDDAAAHQFIAGATAAAPLRPHRKDALVRGAAGNPLFLEELLRAGAAGTDEALPDSVQGAVVSSLDRLPSEDRRLLRYAAVLGVEFDYEAFVHVAGAPVPTFAVLARRWSGLAGSVGPGRLRFSSQVARDVAYEALSFRKRRELHGRAAEFIEATAVDDIPVELLSLHYLNAQRYEKCWTNSVAGAERAMKLRANAECARLAERALAVTRHLPELKTEAIAEVWTHLADALHNLGEYERAEAAYRQVRQLPHASPKLVADALGCEARIAEMQGRPTTAVRRLRRAIRIAADVDESATAAELELLLGWVQHRAGRQQEAKRSAQRALVRAQESSNTRALAEAHLLIDCASLHLGASGPWEHAAHALEIFEELGDLNRAAFTLNFMGAFAYFGGRWDDAAALYGRALETFQRAGNDGDAAPTRYNAAEILLDQGRLDEARSMLEEVEQAYRAVGYRAGMALVRRELGRIAAQEGDLEDAHRLLQDARDGFGALQATGRVLEVDLWTADLLLREARYGEALELVEAVAQQARRSGAAMLTPFVERLRGRIYAAEGQLENADVAFAAALAASRGAGAVHEVALTLQAMKQAWLRCGAAWDGELEAERVELFDRLGIVAAPTEVDAARSGTVGEESPPVT